MLQADEQPLIDSLKKAERAYKGFVGRLETLNQQVYETASSGIGRVSELIDKLTKVSSTGLRVKLSRSTKNDLRTLFESAVGSALSGATLRLRAAIPTKRDKVFAKGPLRELYSGIPQPPDYFGKIQKFEQGGVVQPRDALGRFTNDTDSVLGLLTPGEVVLPKDLVATLTKADTALRDMAGLRKVLTAGLGTPSELAGYTKRFKDLSVVIGQVRMTSKELSIEQRAALAPTLTAIDKKLQALTTTTGKATKSAKALLVENRPARYLAWSAGLEAVNRGLRNVFDEGSRAFEFLSGESPRSFSDSLQQIRTSLGLTSAQLATFGQSLATSASVAGTKVSITVEAANALIQAGVRGTAEIAKQSIAVSQAARLTGGDINALANTSNLLTARLGQSGDQIAALFGDITSLSRNLAIDAPLLVTTLNDVATSSQNVLKGQAPEAVRSILTSVLAIGSASKDVFADSGAALSGIFKEALAGSDTAFKQIQLLSSGAITTQDDLVSRLRTGNLADIFDEFAASVARGERNLQNLAETQGIDANLLKTLVTDTDRFDASLKKAFASTTPVDQFTGALERQSQRVDEVTPLFEKLQRSVTGFVAQTGGLEPLLQVLNEIPPTAALAAFWLGGKLLSAVSWMAGPLIGKATRALGGLLGFGGGGGAVGAAGAATSVAGAAGTAGGLAGAGAFALKAGVLIAGIAAIAVFADDITPLLEEYIPKFFKVTKALVGLTTIGIAETIGATIDGFAPLLGRGPELEAIGGVLIDTAKFLGLFAVVGTELAVLGTAAALGEIIGDFLSYFGIKGPLAALRDQGVAIVDTIWSLTRTFASLESLPKMLPGVQTGLVAGGALVASLLPLIESTTRLGEQTQALEGGVFSASPLIAIQTQAQPLVSTLNLLSESLSRIRPNEAALVGVDYAKKLLTRLVPTLGSVQQLASLDPAALTNFLQSTGGVAADVAVQQRKLGVASPVAELRTPPISPEMVQQVVAQITVALDDSAMHATMREQVALLRQLVEKQSAPPAPAAAPTRVSTLTTRRAQSSEVTRRMLDFT